MVALATQMQHLGAISAMAQKVIDSDGGEGGGAGYKALVCLYMAGGNDGNNMVIPVHNDATISNYTAYSDARSAAGLALTQTELASTQINVPRIAALSPTAATYALHPNFGTFTQNGNTIVNNGIHELWAQQKLAVVCNVGNLVRPMTKSQWSNNSIPKPYQLFSHSDQVNQSQNSNAQVQIFTGWGGRLADKLADAHNPAGLVPMVTSIAGAQLFTAGQVKLPMAIGQAESDTNPNPNPATNNLTTVLAPQGFGLPNPNAVNLARLNAMNAIRQQDIAGSQNYIKAAAGVTETAMQANAALLQNNQEVTAPFPNTSLGLQLKQVARMIKLRDPLNINRQVFYVQIGGFDTHSGELSETSGQNARLREVSQAMRSFWDEMGAQSMQNNVTLFTLSDFGRTLQPSGSGAGVVGSDHAWGNHAFVMGGAVAGGDFYGSLRPDGTGNYYPTLVTGPSGLDDTDNNVNQPTANRGRWIPTTSVEQYAVEMARWFGLAPADETAVFPNLGNFSGGFPQLNFLP
jgi:uncharacterized protein (DUF1501 family)